MSLLTSDNWYTKFSWYITRYAKIKYRPRIEKPLNIDHPQ